MSATSSESVTSNWVLNAARLKRTYLRLLSHYSLVLGRDPTKLPIPDFNQIAMRRHCEWVIHLVRMAGIVLFAAYADSTDESFDGPARETRRPIVKPNVGWLQRHLNKLDSDELSILLHFIQHVLSMPHFFHQLHIVIDWRDLKKRP